MASHLLESNHCYAAMHAITTSNAIITSINASNSATPSFTNTAKLPIETVKRLIAAVAQRPNLWIRNNQNGQKRCDINMLWCEVSEEVHLPADICRIKWGHLRDNFRKVFIRNTFSEETPTTWRFYNDMKFMEKPVAENVMRQNRLKEQSRYWPEMQHDQLYQQVTRMLQPHCNLPICDPKERFERGDGQQFSFSDVKTLFNEAEVHKRIKLEQEEPNDSNGMAYGDLMSDDYRRPEVDVDEDDEFDEDAATEENDNEQSESNARNSNEANDIYTVEVLDDDDDNDDNQTNISNNDNKKHIKLEGTNKNSEEKITMPQVGASTKSTSIKHTATNTELHSDAPEENADRMFLLSLLPFLQKVNEKRKLLVRQKLQNVLIDELV